MVLPVFQATVADAAGNILPGATVTVRRESDNGLASLFSDRAGTSALGNPIITDSNGFIRFYTAEDTYRVDAVSGLTSVTWRHVALSLRIDLTGPLEVGIDDDTQGVLRLFGGGNGESGGQVQFYNAADHDTTDEYWTVEADDTGDFSISRSTSGQDFYIDAASGDAYLGQQSGIAKIGINDTLDGKLYLHGGGAGGDGGEIRFYNAADDDAVNEYGFIHSNVTGDLRFGWNVSGIAFAIQKDRQEVEFAARQLIDFHELMGNNINDELNVWSAEMDLDGSIRYMHISTIRKAAEGAASWHNTSVRIEANVDESTTNQSFIEFYVGADADTHEIRFGEGTNSVWAWFDDSYSLFIGEDDTTPGTLHLYGGGNTEAGGELRLYNAADHDTTDEYWTVRSNADGEFEIGQNTTGPALSIDTSGVVKGVWSHIETQTAVNDASIEFALDITKYSAFKFYLVDVANATDATVLRLRTSSDGGTTFDTGASDYAYTNNRAIMTPTPGDSWSGSNAAAFINLSRLAIGTGSQETLNLEITHFTPNSASDHARFNMTGNVRSSDPVDAVTFGAGTRLDGTNFVDAVQFLASTGNIASGKFILMGLAL